IGYHYLVAHSMYVLLVPLLVIVSVHISSLNGQDFLQISNNHLEFNLCDSMLSLGNLFSYSKLYESSEKGLPTGLYMLQARRGSHQRKVFGVVFACWDFHRREYCLSEKNPGEVRVRSEDLLPRSNHTVPAKPVFGGGQEGGGDGDVWCHRRTPRENGRQGQRYRDYCGEFRCVQSNAIAFRHGCEPYYKLRSNVLSYNVAGMGCSAGIISIDLAKHLLQVNPNSYALVVSMETITLSWYLGNNRPMLVTNCIFRMGGVAILLSNRPSDRGRSKTHSGSDDKSFKCVLQEEDKARTTEVTLSKDVMAVAGEALRTNITTLGPLVLPMSEQIIFFATLVARKVLKAKIKAYIPDFKLAFEHFCMHAGGRAVLDELKKSLELTEWHMEPSRMTLYRFGNTSSSSLWYELAYTEAKGRMKKGDRTWQIAFGFSFKCNSAALLALRSIDPSKEKNVWTDEINDFPVHVPTVQRIAS
ncbi:LOW QUALITY PROTEIN: hypothetical protein RJ639_009891, partial [Escallonia herrerae]